MTSAGTTAVTVSPSSSIAVAAMPQLVDWLDELTVAGRVVNGEARIVSVLWKEGALLRNWEASRVPVYFDFGDSEPEDTPRFETATLWRLNPCGPHGRTYLSAVPKTLFLHVHLKGEPFDETCKKPLSVLRPTIC
jgi:hypothetical protein